MEIFWNELTAGIPESTELAHMLLRLITAILLGAVVGVQRERAGKAAGLRTHILVTLGTTMFVLASTSSGMSLDAVSRVIWDWQYWRLFLPG